MRIPDLTRLEPKDLQKRILATYLEVRVGIAIIGIALPLVLSIGGWLRAHLCLQDSMSAYYHASLNDKSMRDWFVGSLFVIGVFLYLYKGFSELENWLLNVGGILCVGVALFPMEWSACHMRNCDGTAGFPGCLAPANPARHAFSLHGFCAITFFLCLALVCWFCAGDTLPLVKRDKTRRWLKGLYRVIAIAMIVSMAGAYILNTVLQNPARTFFVEAFGVWSFGAYWAIKSWELSHTAADEKALAGRLKNDRGRVVDLTEAAPASR